MLYYLAKRLLTAILVLAVVSFLTFFLSTLAPGDLVESHLQREGKSVSLRQTSYFERLQDYRRVAERHDLHLPAFYFSVRPAVIPDTISHIVRKDERKAMRELLLRHGHQQYVAEYRNTIIRGLAYAQRDRLPAAGDLEFLLSSSEEDRVSYLLQQLTSSSIPDSISLKSQINEIKHHYAQFNTKRSGLTDLLPAFTWHGLDNRYHKWISRMAGGDLGISLIDGRPVSGKISEALRWTLRINVTAILLAFLLAIPLGVYTARRQGSVADRLISLKLFALFAIPSFWLAMLCIVFLTTSEYGAWLDWFPTGGTGKVTAAMNGWQVFGIRLQHLILPVFCTMAGSLAYLTRQMRAGMLRGLKQDYIRMARAKGLSEHAVHWKHAFRNALFPMITIVGSAFPAAISGSVILEVIFSIPGMGRLMYMSILSRDWPVVFAMVMFASILTILGYLIADLLYRWADPRVELQTQKA